MIIKKRKTGFSFVCFCHFISAYVTHQYVVVRILVRVVGRLKMTKANKAKTGLGFLMYSTDTTTADLSVSSTVVCSVSWQCFVSWQRPLKADIGLFFINQLCHKIPKEDWDLMAQLVYEK